MRDQSADIGNHAVRVMSGLRPPSWAPGFRGAESSGAHGRPGHEIAAVYTQPPLGPGRPEGTTDTGASLGGEHGLPVYAHEPA